MQSREAVGAENWPQPPSGRSAGITTLQQRAALVLELLEGAPTTHVIEYDLIHDALMKEFEELGMKPHGAVRVASDVLGGGSKGHGAKAVRLSPEGTKELVVSVARAWAEKIVGQKGS